MRWVVAAIAALIAVGCARVATVVPSPPQRAQLGPGFLPNEQKDVLSGKLTYPGGRLATFAASDKEQVDQVIREFMPHPIKVRLSFFRNPGVWVFALEPLPQFVLTQRDKDTFKSIIEENGGLIDADGKLDAKYGPDGKTPMIMPMIGGPEMVGNEAYAKPVKTTMYMYFPSEAKAREAMKYMDKRYKLKLEKQEATWALQASVTIQYGQVTDEGDAFFDIVPRLGGKMESYTSDVPEGAPP